MTDEFLSKEYELSYEQLRYYDDRHTNMMKYMFTLTSSVATAQFAIYKFTQGFTQGFFAFQSFLSVVVFIATVLLYLAMLRNRLYFVYMVRQVNAIRKYFLENEAKQFQHNQLYTSTDFPALKIFSVHTFQMLGASILSSLFAGVLVYSINPAFGKDSSLMASCIVFALVVIVEVVGGVVYLSSIKGKSADQAIHGKGITPGEYSQKKVEAVKRTKKSRNIDMVTSGILLFSFSITVLIQTSIDQQQKIIAYVALFISIVFAICAVFPWDMRFFSNKWTYIWVNTFAFLAWFFTFALKWLNGIIGTKDIEQSIVSVVGVLWLLSIMILLTSALTNATKNFKEPIKWFPWLIPLALLIQTIRAFMQGDYWAGGAMVIFALFSVLIVLRVWEPTGKLPLGLSE